jgi:hypothetical protein
VADWYSYCREVTTLSLDELYDRTGRIGGPGHIVEIDESKFGKRKYNRGRIIEGDWLLGMINKGIPGQARPEEGEFRVEICPENRRNRATLIPLIQKHVEVGSTIMHDEWGAYDNLEQYGYHHLSVNHTRYFVDPISGANTQTIESNWRPLKANILRTQSIRKEYLADHLCEYLWRRNVDKSRGGEYFESLVEDITALNLDFGPPDHQ